MQRREVAKEERRSRILDAAERLIRERGATGLSMRTLATEAEVAFVTPFNLFDNKAGVLLALIEKRIDAQIWRHRTPIATVEPFEGIFEQAVVGSRAYSADPGLYRPLLLALASSEHLDHQRIAQRSTELWLFVIEPIVAGGRLDDGIEPRRFARSLHASFRTALMLWAEGWLGDDELELQAQLAVACSALPVLDDAGANWVLQRIHSLRQAN